MITGIYSITNIIDNKKYIGQAVNIKQRWNSHIYDLKNNIDSYHLQNAWNKYGEENFIFEIIEECDKKELDKLEKFWITKYNTIEKKNGYNLTKGGNRQKEISTETRLKLKKALKNRIDNLDSFICPECKKEIKRVTFNQKGCKECYKKRQKKYSKEKRAYQRKTSSKFTCSICNKESKRRTKNSFSQKICESCKEKKYKRKTTVSFICICGKETKRKSGLQKLCSTCQKESIRKRDRLRKSKVHYEK